MIHIISTECNETIPQQEETIPTELSPGKPPIHKNHIEIEDLASFKSSKELFPNVEPYIKILPKGAKSKL